MILKARPQVKQAFARELLKLNYISIRNSSFVCQYWIRRFRI